MKGTIFAIKPMEMHDGDGIRTTVFFKGCPLRCVWCHNPEGISQKPQIALFKNKCAGCGLCVGNKTEDTAKSCPTGAQVLYGAQYEAQELAKILSRDKAFFDQSGGGVTFSGGECLLQSDFAFELSGELSKLGVNVYVDTSGYAPWEAFEKIIPTTKKFLYDIKAINPEVHKKCTGRDNGIILKNLELLLERGCDVEIRIPLVAQYNDGEISGIGAYLKSLGFKGKIKVLQYHNFAGSRYEALEMENTLPNVQTTMEHTDNAVKTLKSYGLFALNGARED